MDNYEEVVNQALNINPYVYCYSTFSKILTVTNENLIEVYGTVISNNTEALLPASSGEEYITAKAMGAANVTVYDINLLTKYYTYLKIAALKYFNNVEDFKKFIISYENNDDFLDFNTFMKIMDYLPTNESLFWFNYLKKASRTQINNLFPYISKEHYQALTKLSLIYNEDFYDNNKRMLAYLEYPEFILSDLKELTNKTNKRFDLIDCSNIIECEVVKSMNAQGFQVIYSEDYFEKKWLKYLKEELTKLLKDKGRIIADYRLSVDDGEQSDFLFNNNDLEEKEFISGYPKQKSAILILQR